MFIHLSGHLSNADGPVCREGDPFEYTETRLKTFLTTCFLPHIPWCCCTSPEPLRHDMTGPQSTQRNWSRILIKGMLVLEHQEWLLLSFTSLFLGFALACIKVALIACPQASMKCGGEESGGLERPPVNPRRKAPTFRYISL